METNNHQKHNTGVNMTLQEINMKIKQCTTTKKFIHFQILFGKKNKNIDWMEERARALIETIDETNRLQDLKKNVTDRNCP